MSEVSLEEMESSLLEVQPGITMGGYWKPQDCLPRWKVRELRMHNKYSIDKENPGKKY